MSSLVELTLCSRSIPGTKKKKNHPPNVRADMGPTDCSLYKIRDLAEFVECQPEAQKLVYCAD